MSDIRVIPFDPLVVLVSLRFVSFFFVDWGYPFDFRISSLLRSIQNHLVTYSFLGQGFALSGLKV
jgi:hypothetical protein